MESVSIPDDLIQNLAAFAQNMKNYGPPTSNVDTSDIPETTGVYYAPPAPKTPPKAPVSVSPGFGLNTISNIGINNSTLEETTRLLALQKDPHNEFKVDVKELIKIEEMIEKYAEIIRKLKAKKEDLRVKTFKHMVHHKVDNVNVSTEESYNIVTTKKKINPMTKARLPSKIRDFFIKEEKMDESKAETLANRILTWINENAEYAVSKTLRHKKPRKPRK